MNEELLGLLGATPEQIAQARRRSGFEELALLGQALSAAGAPAPRGTSTLQRLGQAGQMYTQAPRQSMDTLLQSLLQKQQIEKAQKERQAGILREQREESYIAGLPSHLQPLARMNLPGFVSKQIERQFEKPQTLDTKEKTTLYMSAKYGTTDFALLSNEAKMDVLRFANAPNDKELAELVEKSKRLEFETGKGIPIPRGRSEYLGSQSSVGVAPSVVSPPVATVSSQLAVEPKMQQVSQEITPKAAQQLGLKMSQSVASTPLKENEKPLIESSAISPKNKQELLLVQPKQTQAVEYVLETNTLLLDAINEALANPGFDDAFGLMGGMISSVPSSNAARVKELLTKIGGNLFIEAITAMRAASATGAAVGSVTEREGEKLEKSKAAIGQAQQAKDARSELEALKRTLEFQRNLVTNAYERTYGRGTFLQRPPTKPKEQRKSLQSIFGGQQ